MMVGGACGRAYTREPGLNAESGLWADLYKST